MKVAPLLVLVQITSLQLGSAVAKLAYDQVGPTALAGLRLAFAAIMMLILVRPRLRLITALQWRAVICLGIVLAAMNTAYFQAIAYLPIGVASTLELLGPLVLAIALSRRWQQLAAAVPALIGVLLLASPGAGTAAAGIIFGVAAGLCRAGYVVFNQQVGVLFQDWTGLTLALAIGACVLTPVAAISEGVAVIEHPWILAVGLLVALLSSVIPYSLDMASLRLIPVPTFGVLLALSPAIAALVGFIVLGEHLGPQQLCAIALIVTASAWAISTGSVTRRRSGPRRRGRGG